MTLDDDVADRLASEARRSGRPFRVVVNEAIRRGLETRPEVEPYRAQATDMRRRPEFDLDNIAELLDRLDGPLRR